MLCESCGRALPTQPATLYQNIGMIALSRHQTLKGAFCHPCITHYFWEYTLVTLALGWWGLISFFLTPLILMNNLFYFLRAQMRQAQPTVGLASSSSYIPPLESCPRCQAGHARRVRLSRSVWASLGVSLLLLIWAMYLSAQIVKQHTPSTNWVVVGLFLTINLFVAFCLAMLVNHPLRRCDQCHWTWPMQTSA